MKPKSFNRNMRRELADTLAAHGIVAVVAAIATVSAWDYASWWMASLASDLSTLLHLQVGDPGAEPDTVLRNPLDTLADTLATGKVGGLLAAVAAVAVTIMVLGLVSWARSWLRLHDGTFAGDRAPTRTHGDAWLESRPSRVARRCPPWDGKEAARGLVAAGCVGGGIAMVPAIHCLIRAGSGAGKTRRSLAVSVAAAIDRNAHGIPTSVIVHDPKSEIRAWTEPLARRAGMEVVAIRLDEPVKSARFNPLDRAIAALGTEGVAGAVAELRELSSAIVPDAFSSGQRFFTDASRNLLTGLCLLAIADGRIPDGARNLSTVLALLEPRDGKSAVKSLEELAADLPAGNPARQFLLVASSNGGGGEALVSTARNYLMSFCDDDVSRMLWDGEVDLASVGRKPTILYIASATDRGDRGALVSCIFSQALSALRETARLSGGRLPAETLLAIDEGSGHRIVSGMGELHLDVILERIRREYGIAPRVGQPQVIRRETPKRTASATGIFDRELGKETHIGEVALSIAPRERGSGNQIRFAIDTAILPAAFVDAVRQGVENALQSDPVTGYPLQDADVEITAMPRRDGSTVAGYHMAAGIALRSALEAAQVTTLEPLMFVEISAPEANLGPAISLFGTRGGKVENILDHAGLKLVQGLAPLSKLFGFSTDLRSATQGRAGLMMRFERFDVI